jgi:prophage DNA circulation protein
MIFIGSRYENEEVRYFLDPRSNTTRPTVTRSSSRVLQRAEQLPRMQVRWNSAYRLDQIANKTLGSETRWWQVMDANSEVLNPLSIEPGTVINIP